MRLLDVYRKMRICTVIMMLYVLYYLCSYDWKKWPIYVDKSAV